MTEYFSSVFENNVNPLRTFVNRVDEIERIASGFFRRGERVIAVTGARGHGRTSLIEKFSHDYRGHFADTLRLGGMDTREFYEMKRRGALERSTIVKIGQADGDLARISTPECDPMPIIVSGNLLRFCKRVARNFSARYLVLIDGFFDESDYYLSVLRELLPNSCFLIVTTDDEKLDNVDHFIKLGPLNRLHFREAVLRHFGLALDQYALDSFFEGNKDWLAEWEEKASALKATMGLTSEVFRKSFSGDTLRARLTMIFERRHLLTDFFYSGLIGPDGKSLARRREGAVLAHVLAADAALLQMAAKDPTSMHSMSPRQFEELVAHVLERLGYSVTLTPATRDGGLDIYAAKNDDLGQFLYLVECKKFAPDRPVGVQLVRSLYGTLEHTKATAGILVTTSSFTRDAKSFQKEIKARLSLRDYVDLQSWLNQLR
ncbi:restriction endonuclease [Bradyrhizobium roseum]|uniref:restriction endonuclease n=1 Tax=Bradyrhizobium roseum TaxID=3056648 RepID=UPI0026331701|nr:restriction endonuclease [Bradyrhizobium roseus]WKA31335.1 restriction endonuclease [Bradyrhizobium roseus]